MVNSTLSGRPGRAKYSVSEVIVDRTLWTPAHNSSEEWKEFYAKTGAAEGVSFGVVMNSFEELEPEYAKGYKKARNGRVWCIGPVSLSNKDELDKAERGNKASIDEHFCLKWLDSQKPKGVIYVCLGSMCNITSLQLIELGLALEASKRPFIWVIREGNQLGELEKWIKEQKREIQKVKSKLLLLGIY